MNEAVVKWFALSTVASVVIGALWLAASVQAKHAESGQRNASRLGAVKVSQASIIPQLHFAALPPQQAASGVTSARSQVSVR